jgi:hypothetical protein
LFLAGLRTVPSAAQVSGPALELVDLQKLGQK